MNRTVSRNVFRTPVTVAASQLCAEALTVAVGGRSVPGPPFVIWIVWGGGSGQPVTYSCWSPTYERRIQGPGTVSVTGTTTGAFAAPGDTSDTVARYVPCSSQTVSRDWRACSMTVNGGAVPSTLAVSQAGTPPLG